MYACGTSVLFSDVRALLTLATTSVAAKRALAMASCVAHSPRAVLGAGALPEVLGGGAVACMVSTPLLFCQS